MATAEEYAGWIVANADKKGTPEFNTVAQAYNLAKGGMAPKRAPIETPQFEKDAATIANATPAEVIAGYPAVRVAIGASDPIRGGAQRLMNMMGMGGAMNQNESALDKLIETGRVAYGDTGMDTERLGGNILSPLGLTVAKVIPGASTALGRIGIGAGVGAGFGALTPNKDATGAADDLSKAGLNALLGGAVGGAIPGVLEAAKPIGRAGVNMYDGIMAAFGNQAAASRSGARLGVKVSGDRVDDVITAMENSRDIVPGSKLTAGQAAVPANSAEFSAFQKIVQQSNPSLYAGEGRSGQQEAARKAVLMSLAENPAFANPNMPPIEKARLVREANAALNYGAVGKDKISPIAPEEVFAARIAAKEASKASALQDAGRFQTAAAQQKNLANGGAVRLAPGQPNQGGTGPMRFLSAAEAERAPRMQSEGAPQMNVGATGGSVTSPSAYPVPGYPRIPPRYTHNIDRVPEAQGAAQDALTIATQRQKEADFIKYQLDALIKTVGPENPKLTQLLQRPSMQKALVKAQEGAAEADAYFPSKAGDPFSVNNLHRMKMAMDDAIKNPERFGLGATEAKEIGGTRDEFVKWIAKRSPGYDKARQAYRADSEPINRMEIGGVLSKALDTPVGVGERPGVLASAMENARLTQKRAGGTARYATLEEAMGPEGFRKAQMVLADLKRNKQFEELATAGASEAGRIARRQLDVVENPHFLSKASTIFNMIMHPIESASSDKVLRQAAVDMQNPQVFAKMMQEATPAQRKVITDWVMRMGAANAANVKEQVE